MNLTAPLRPGCLATGMILVLVWQPRIQAENPPQLSADLATSFHSREKFARTVACTWRCKEGRALPGGTDAFGNGKPAETKLSTSHYSRTLEVDGDLVRFEDGAPQWAPDWGKFVESSSITVINGSNGKTLSKLELPTGAQVQGTIARVDKAAHFMRSHFDLLPLLEQFRPSWRLEALLAGVKREAEMGSIAGRACAIYRVKRGGSCSYWFDTTRENSVLRVLRDVNGKVLLQEDREYKELGAHGWVLNRWKSVEIHEDGSVRRSIEAEVVSVKINEPIPADHFDITFPPGTKIIDTTGNSQ